LSVDPQGLGGFSTSFLFDTGRQSYHTELWLDVIKQVDKIATDEEAKKLREIYQGIEDTLAFVRRSGGKFEYLAYDTDTQKYSDVLGEMLVSRGYKPDEIMSMWYMRFSDYCYQGGEGYGFHWERKSKKDYTPKYLSDIPTGRFRSWWGPGRCEYRERLDDYYHKKYLGETRTLASCPHHWCIRPAYFEFAKPSLLEMMAILSSPFIVGVSSKLTKQIWGD
jgi:hypothetical protein